MTSRLVAVVACLTATIASTAAWAATPPVPRAAAQGADSTTLAPLEGDLPGIIPKPNSGVEPQRSGDRGGWAQLLLLAMLAAAVTVVLVVIARSTARVTQAKGDRPDPPG